MVVRVTSAEFAKRFTGYFPLKVLYGPIEQRYSVSVDFWYIKDV
jgi:hypothetical protein